MGGAGGGNVRKKLKDGTEVKSSVTLGCATLIYSVMAPERGGETLFAHGGVLYDLLPEELARDSEASIVGVAPSASFCSESRRAGTITAFPFPAHENKLPGL